MATPEAFPADWFILVSEALSKARAADPTKIVWGLSLPTSWMAELQSYQRNGELTKMFNVRAVSFVGKTIGTFDDPKIKKDPKSKKVG